MNRPRILITGGAGYIGSIVNKMLSDKGYETIVLDDLSTGKREMAVRGTFFHGDVADEQLLQEIFSKKIDAVMHFAALTSVGESVKNPIAYYQANTAKTLTLLKKMAEHGVDHFVFSSTAAVYGIPTQFPIPESAPLSPINPYGSSKLMIEMMLRDISAATNIKYITFRYFNAAGGDPNGEIRIHNLAKTNLIPLLMDHPSGAFFVNGNDYPTPDGTCIRDYIHIYDLATAHMLGLEKLLDGCKSTVYNLGTGCGFSVQEVINTFCKITGKKIDAVVGPRRPGDPPILIADAERARCELNWEPKFPQLEMIIHDAWNCYQPLMVKE